LITDRHDVRMKEEQNRGNNPSAACNSFFSELVQEICGEGDADQTGDAQKFVPEGRSIEAEKRGNRGVKRRLSGIMPRLLNCTNDPFMYHPVRTSFIHPETSRKHRKPDGGCQQAKDDEKCVAVREGVEHPL